MTCHHACDGIGGLFGCMKRVHSCRMNHDGARIAHYDRSVNGPPPPNGGAEIRSANAATYDNRAGAGPGGAAARPGAVIGAKVTHEKRIGHRSVRRGHRQPDHDGYGIP